MKVAEREVDEDEIVLDFDLGILVVAAMAGKRKRVRWPRNHAGLGRCSIRLSG
jgi:hypothetical protein